MGKSQTFGNKCLTQGPEVWKQYGVVRVKEKSQNNDYERSYKYDKNPSSNLT